MKAIYFLFLAIILTGCETVPPHTVTADQVQFIDFVPANSFDMGMIDLPHDDFSINRFIDLKPSEKSILKLEAAENGANFIYGGHFQAGQGRLFFHTYWLPPQNPAQQPPAAEPSK